MNVLDTEESSLIPRFSLLKCSSARGLTVSLTLHNYTTAFKVQRIHVSLISVCQPNSKLSYTRLASRITILIIQILDNQAMIRRVQGVRLYENVISRLNKEISTGQKHVTIKAW